MNSISVVIPTYKRNDLLQQIITALKPQKKYIKEILVVDNDPKCSAKLLLQLTEGMPIKYLKNIKNGACGSRNLGIKKSQSKIVALLDDDTIPQKDWAFGIIKFFEHNKNEKCIVMGKNLNGLQNSVIASVEYFQTELTYRTNFMNMKKDVCSLALDSKNCAFLRQQILKDSLFFDTRFGEVTSFEDIDFGIRARQKGYRIYVKENIVAVHKGRTTLNRYIQRELQKTNGLRIFSKKWEIQKNKIQKIYKLAWESENIEPFQKVKKNIENEILKNRSLLFVILFHLLIKGIDVLRKIYTYGNINQNS